MMLRTLNTLRRRKLRDIQWLKSLNYSRSQMSLFTIMKMFSSDFKQMEVLEELKGSKKAS